MDKIKKLNSDNVSFRIDVSPKINEIIEVLNSQDDKAELECYVNLYRAEQAVTKELHAENKKLKEQQLTEDEILLTIIRETGDFDREVKIRLATAIIKARSEK